MLMSTHHLARNCQANPERPILSNVPDTSVTPLQENDLFFVLACDGVWDVLTDQQVCLVPRAIAATAVRVVVLVVFWSISVFVDASTYPCALAIRS